MTESKNSIKEWSSDNYDELKEFITNMKSLDDLNSRLERPVTMEHFRANIVVDGELPFEEDHWQKITIGEVVFKAVKPCSRCILTTVNPATGIRDKTGEPLKTLASYRMLEPGKIIFGMNLVIEKNGVVKVGDEVKIN